MPPRKASARRNKSSSTKAPNPVNEHELPAPEVKTETQLADDAKVKETQPEMSMRVEVSDSNRAGTGVVLSSESMVKEEVVMPNRSAEDVIEDVVDIQSGSEDLQEDENVDEEEEEDPEEDEDVSELEKNAEIISAQEETNAVQVDDSEIRNGNNNDEHSDTSKSLCKNKDALVVNNEGINGTTEMVSIQESAQAVSSRTSNENNTALVVKDDSMLDMDDDESVDYSEDDDAENEGDGDQDPSLIVQGSSSDNKKEKGAELYVGRLDKSVVEDDLVSIFQQFGELKSTRIVTKQNSKKSKGFGFVRFATVDQAKHALSELKDGVEVRGKRIVISASQDHDTLYVGNICKTWTQDQVLQQLKEYGIEQIEVFRLPKDSKFEKKNKGFAFLEFGNHSDLVAAFQRLKKPDAAFGRDVSAKVAFAQSTLHSTDEDLSEVNQVHLEGLTKDWTEEKVNDICKKYGEVLKVNLFPGKRNKRKDFGFVTFNSSESALACVEGINNTAFEGDAKIKASIARKQQKGRIPKQVVHGGFEVEKQSEKSNQKSQPKSSKMKGVLNTQKTKTKKTFPSKNKTKGSTVKPQQKGSLKKDGESSKEAEISKMKGDNGPQQRKRKRNAFSEQKSSARDLGLGAPKKPKNGGEGQNSQSVSRAGYNKRKNPLGNESREDRGNRNTQGKNRFKKQRGNKKGRERENFRNPRNDPHTRRGHDDYINPARYAPQYAAASASNTYHVASDRSLRYKEMEPHAGYIEPAYGKRTGSYSGYVPSVARAPHTQHQTVYLEPSSRSQSQMYPRYLDRPVVTQSYRDYRPPASVQIARDHYDPGPARGAGVHTYAGGPPHPASQVPSHSSYYQAGGSYGGAYGNRGAYY